MATVAGAARAAERRLRRTRRLARWRLRRSMDRALGRKPRAHLLHPGKTGGTAVKAALQPVRTSGRYDIRLHEHRTTLRDIPHRDKVFLVLRDPAERFVSAFNSRLRQGRPRFDVPWSPEERAAFAEFPTADALACALSDPDPGRRVRAFAAMSSIQHVRDSLWRWFVNGQTFQRRAEDLLLIMWLPDLAAGFSELCARLELPAGTALPGDDVVAHRSPAEANTFLSEPARANLRWWYSRDDALIEMCAGLDCFIGPSWTSPLGAGGRGAGAPAVEA